MRFDIIGPVNAIWDRSPWVDPLLVFSISEVVLALQLQLN